MNMNLGRVDNVGKIFTVAYAAELERSVESRSEALKRIAEADGELYRDIGLVGGNTEGGDLWDDGGDVEY